MQADVPRALSPHGRRPCRSSGRAGRDRARRSGRAAHGFPASPPRWPRFRRHRHRGRRSALARQASRERAGPPEHHASPRGRAAVARHSAAATAPGCRSTAATPGGPPPAPGAAAGQHRPYDWPLSRQPLQRPPSPPSGQQSTAAYWPCGDARFNNHQDMAMRSSKLIHIVGCHCEGEVGDVIVGGVAPPPGTTVWEQSRFIAADGRLRDFELNEPRGGVFRHVNLLVPPTDPQAQMGWIIMEPADTPPMSGSNAICVATVLLETGILPMTEPRTHLVLEAPGGLVEAHAACRDGRVERVCIRNLPSFADRLDATLEVAGIGTLTVDTAYGGDSFVCADAQALGFALTADEARDLAVTGTRITAAANEQLGFHHPENPHWSHISFCQIAAPLTHEDGVAVSRNAV